MRLWFDVLYLCLGLGFLGYWLFKRSGPRSPKHPYLYFGIGVTCSGIAELLPPSPLSMILKVVGTISVVAAAILMFTFTDPAHADPATPKSPDAPR